MFDLIYREQVVKQLKKLPWKKREQVIEKLKKLSINPYTEEINIKKLSGTSRSYRLRVDDIRVIYELDQSSQKIYIWKIGFRGQIY